MSPARSPTAAVSSRRIRSTSSRSAPAASDWRLLELDDLERLDEERLAGAGRVVDDARDRAPGAGLDGEDRPAAALRDEVLLQVLLHALAPRQPAQLVGDAAAALAKLPPQAAELGRGAVLQVGAVGLDPAPDRLGHAAEARVDRGRELVQQRRRLGLPAQSRPRGERAGDRRPDAAELGRGEQAAEGGAVGRGANVLDPAQRWLDGGLDQRDRLGGQRLPARDLVRVGRRRQRPRHLGAGRGSGRAGKSLRDRGELERGECGRIHGLSVGPPSRSADYAGSEAGVPEP